MASIGREGKRGELKRIIFRDANGKQKTLRLGECSKETARAALVGFKRVLEAHRHNSTIHPDGVRWLEGIDDRLYARVVRLGLAQPRKGSVVVTLGDLLDRFEAASTVKPTTRAAYKQTMDSLRAHFGADMPLTEITPADADDWRKAIAEPVKSEGPDGAEVTKQLAPATVAKRTHVAKTIFRRAVRWKMIPTSPFADLRPGSQANPDRAFYVDRKTAAAVIEECPDNEWRAIVALSRYAGLRCPSELVGLRWGDVNWERGRLTVRSPKTAGHDGHAVRVVPIAPELRPILLVLFDEAEPGAERVIPRADSASNLRTHLLRIIQAAGVKPWPRLFHNMRASCATDWVETFPAHVVAGWLGHSPLIAARHYLQTRDAHFELATGGAGQNPATNPATHARTDDPTENDADAEIAENPEVLVEVGIGCDPVESGVVGATGLEPVTSSM